MAFRVEPSSRLHFDEMGVDLKARVRAISGFDEKNRLIAIGGYGYASNGAVFAFAELTDEALKSPISLHRAGLRVLEMARVDGVKRMIALSDHEFSVKAAPWLARLGFRPGRFGGHDVWIWKAN